jgi:hypothetical protein
MQNPRQRWDLLTLSRVGQFHQVKADDRPRCQVR